MQHVNYILLLQYDLIPLAYSDLCSFCISAQGGNNNSVLLEHIEQVRRSQLAVCQTAQLVQEQVAQLVASRAQLEAHRAALHHHLAAVTSIIASTANHASTTTSTTVASTSVGTMSHSSLPNCTPVTVAVVSTSTSSSLITSGTHSVAVGGSCATSTATTATSTTPGLCHPIPLTTTTPSIVAGHAGHPVAAVINRSLQSLVPAASVMSWTGLASPYLGSTNIALSLEGKDGVFYSHVTAKDSGKDIKTVFTSANTSKPNNRISISHGSSKTSSSNSRHNSNKSHKHVSVETTNNSPMKYNGIPPGLPKQIFKPLQLSGPNINSSTSKKVTKTMTYTQPTNITGLPQPSVALVTPTTTSSSQNGLVPLPIIHSAVSKNGRPNKTQVAYAPYSKTSPTKVTQSQPWISN